MTRKRLIPPGHYSIKVLNTAKFISPKNWALLMLQTDGRHWFALVQPDDSLWFLHKPRGGAVIKADESQYSVEYKPKEYIANAHLDQCKRAKVVLGL